MKLPMVLQVVFVSQHNKMKRVFKKNYGFTTTMKTSCGFTLIEILVVITILAILMVLAFASYETAQRQARDTKRKSDLVAISRALEQYRVDNGKYLTQTAWSDASSWTTFATYLSPSYMAQVPKDPKNGGSGRAENWYVYGYVALNSGARYRLCANLENNSDSARNVDYPTVPTHTPAPLISCSGDTNLWGDFKVESQQ